MKVLLSAVMQPSHFFPMVPLGWVLRAAGHDVRVAHQPCLTPFVAASGLTSVVVGSDFQVDPTLRSQAQESQSSREKSGGAAASGTSMSARPSPDEQLHHNRATMWVFSNVAELMAGDLIGFARHWKPDLIVFDWQCYAAQLAAEVLDIPSIRHQFAGPDFGVGIPGWRELERDALLELYRKHGVSEVRPDGELTIDPCPPTLQFPLPLDRRYLPVRHVPYNGPGQVQEWMYRRDSRPRIALTMGGTYLWLMGNLAPVQKFIELLAELDVEVIAAVPRGGTEILGATGPNVRLAENVPLELFLPGCDVIISHGGTGTVGTAMVHGVPQIISPPSSMGEPPFHNAERIVGAGVGEQVDIYTDPPERLRKTVEAVVNTASYRTAAATLAAEVRARPLPMELVGELEAVAFG